MQLHHSPALSPVISLQSETEGGEIPVLLTNSLFRMSGHARLNKLWKTLSPVRYLGLPATQQSSEIAEHHGDHDSK